MTDIEQLADDLANCREWCDCTFEEQAHEDCDGSTCSGQRKAILRALQGIFTAQKISATGNDVPEPGWYDATVTLPPLDLIVICTDGQRRWMDRRTDYLPDLSCGEHKAKYWYPIPEPNVRELELAKMIVTRISMGEEEPF